jgi:preprotein translocase subunit SecD
LEPLPSQRRIKLGLDLRGIHFVMKVSMDDALNAVTDETLESLSLLLDDNGVTFEDVNAGERRLRVTGVDATKGVISAGWPRTTSPAGTSFVRTRPPGSFR